MGEKCTACNVKCQMRLASLEGIPDERTLDEGPHGKKGHRTKGHQASFSLDNITSPDHVMQSNIVIS